MSTVAARDTGAGVSMGINQWARWWAAQVSTVGRLGVHRSDQADG